MKILGLNNEMYISSACLLGDGKIIAAAAEERFTREKLSRKFPQQAIEYCLREAGLKINEIDFIAIAWNPGVYFSKFNPILSDQRRHLVELLYSVPDQVMRFYGRPKVDHISQEIKGDFGKASIHYITHHRAHAANGFFLSGFNSAAILTSDAQGEFESTTFCHGRDNKINLLQDIYYPHSLGALYSTFTEFLGFRPNSDEWKVMALAGLAGYKNKYFNLMKQNIIRLKNDGTFELDLSYFKGYIHEQPNLYSEKIVKEFGPARKTEEKISQRHYEIAAALQKATEDTLAHLLRHLHKKTSEKNLVLSGGTFMNSVFNGKVLDITPFEKVFISSCPDDSGNCFGAGLFLFHQILGKKRNAPLMHNYFGPQFSALQIRESLEGFKIPYTYEKNIEFITAKLISEGKIIGWFQGRMEFGQRALGNRSILADPRSAGMKDKINSAVKFRESFRPFAPAILKEKQEEYFEINNRGDVNFMEKVYRVKFGKSSQIPAVVHADGTGRIQTVNKETNPRLHLLISEFEKITKIPIVLNTSFNLNDEPIVCKPKEAIRTFFSCGLDYLVMGNYLVKKG